MTTSVNPWRERAQRLDETDELKRFRAQFRLPEGVGDEAAAYMCGNSLGLQPVDVEARIARELSDWARLAVRGHHEARAPWYPYHERFRAPLSRVVGAKESEVVVMNGLTANLHLLMVSFFRPEGERSAILIERPAFPSDRYAVETQLRFHGLDPAEHLIEVGDPSGETPLDDAALIEAIEEHGHRIALIMIGGVNFLTGQFFDLAEIVRAGKAKGCTVGFDLAHAAGNVPLHLHDWGPDFAAWCSYKYMNAGPGAVAGAFVHERHHGADLPRFGGWWGNDPATRFKMQLIPDFQPVASADAWQLSNPPVLALAPLEASLDLFDAAGMDALREKSIRLTGFMEELLDEIPGRPVVVTTPRDPSRRGCQLSLRVGPRAREIQAALEAAGVVTDFREPDVIRAAPTPLYNSFDDVARFVSALCVGLGVPVPSSTAASA